MAASNYLVNNSQRSYYEGDVYGDYQFTSLKDIINQFMVVYVGEEKIIPKASRMDVAFHAQRAMQELSFDVFKSTKSQEIVLPSSLTMILPHDYVNYVKLSWSDSAGIEHLLYPASKTSNPLKILQEDNGGYDFAAVTSVLLTNGDFSDSTLTTTNIDGWQRSWVSNTPTIEDVSITSGELKFIHGSAALPSPAGGTSVTARAYAVWQKIDVRDLNELELKATGLSAASESGVKGDGILRVGLSTLVGSASYNPNVTNLNNVTCRNNDPTVFDLLTIGGQSSYVEFADGAGTESTETLTGIDVTGLDEVYVLITSTVVSFSQAWTVANSNESTNTVDDVEITYDGVVDHLQTSGDSTTWTNYKSESPSDLDIGKYDDGTYDLIRGERYGIDPQHSQVNGSFYIDVLRGLINFSSNISGKTVVLDYISDSLGTEEEVKVHKLAEEAMYKWIAYGILAARANTPEYIVQRFKRERFAETRKAKLRLSNIKLEEITQILRGKSKHIKH